MSKPQAIKQRRVFHLLPNAHLDPVWLWDWREGLNEGLTTVRTILDLMDEFPQLTFIRGESSIYEHIEKTDRATFHRLERMVGTGRWDIVGGTYNQPDTNLAATETLCRQYETGLAYFAKRFGVTPRVGWQADSFGHTPGLPNVLRAFGIDGFAFTRPDRRAFPMPEPAFWWESDQADAILCYRQHYVAYCSDRNNLPAILDTTLLDATPLPLVNVGILMGLGNHGGGPSRRHIADAEAWAAAHPDVEVRFSTLHGFFDALRAEVTAKDAVPTPRLRGDMGFCLRGCYSSVAKFKFAYRRAEALVAQAETTQTILSESLGFEPASLASAWEGILFNSFHDILPGSSIERAFDDQLSWVGSSAHQAQAVRFAALNRLAQRIDTSVPIPSQPDRPTDAPLLVWNPLARPFCGWVELEANLDYRPVPGFTTALDTLPLSLTGPDGMQVPFQEIRTEHSSMRNAAWRKRLLIHTEIPAMGWKVFQLGYRDQPVRKNAPEAGACVARDGQTPAIANKDWEVSVADGGNLRIRYRGRDFFDQPGTLGVRVVEDGWGSWGGMQEEPESLLPETVREAWTVREHALLETGPERAKLWTRWQGANSWLDLTFALSRDGREVRVEGRLLWNERSARLLLVLPSSGKLVMQVPASRAERSQTGNLPCGRWFRRGNQRTGIGFVSDGLSDLNATATEIRVTIARASRYADDVLTPPDQDRWMPATDCGELRFQFWLAAGAADLELLAQELLQPPVALCVPPGIGEWPRSGSLARVEPEQVVLLAAHPGDDGRLQVRLQNLSDRDSDVRLTLGEIVHEVGTLGPYEISNLILSTAPKSGQARQEGIRRNGNHGSEGRGAALTGKNDLTVRKGSKQRL